MEKFELSDDFRLKMDKMINRTCNDLVSLFQKELARHQLESSPKALDLSIKTAQITTTAPTENSTESAVDGHSETLLNSITESAANSDAVADTETNTHSPPEDENSNSNILGNSVSQNTNADDVIERNIENEEIVTTCDCSPPTPPSSSTECTPRRTSFTEADNQTIKQMLASFEENVLKTFRSASSGVNTQNSKLTSVEAHASADQSEITTEGSDSSVTDNSRQEVPITIKQENASFEEVGNGPPETTGNSVTTQVKTGNTQPTNSVLDSQQATRTAETLQQSQQTFSGETPSTGVTIKPEPSDADSVETPISLSVLESSNTVTKEIFTAAPVTAGSDSDATLTVQEASTASEAETEGNMTVKQELNESEFDDALQMYYNEEFEDKLADELADEENQAIKEEQAVNVDQANEDEEQSQNADENLSVIAEQRTTAVEFDASKEHDSTALETPVNTNPQIEQQLSSLSLQLPRLVLTTVLEPSPNSAFERIIPRQTSLILPSQQTSPLQAVEDDQNTAISTVQSPKMQSKKLSRKRCRFPVSDDDSDELPSDQPDQSSILTKKESSKLKKKSKIQAPKQKLSDTISKSSKKSPTETPLKTKNPPDSTPVPVKKLKTKTPKSAEISSTSTTPKTAAVSASSTAAAALSTKTSTAKLVKPKKPSTTPKSTPLVLTERINSYDIMLPTREMRRTEEERRRKSTSDDQMEHSSSDHDREEKHFNASASSYHSSSKEEEEEEEEEEEKEMEEELDDNNGGNWYCQTSSKYNDIRVVELKCHDGDCNLMFDRMKQHKKHMEDAHRRLQYSCLVCLGTKTFKTKIMLDMHMDSTHPEAESAICRYCQHKSQNEYLLYGHYVFCHEQGKFACTKCNEFTGLFRKDVADHINITHPDMVAGRRQMSRQSQNHHLNRSYSAESKDVGEWWKKPTTTTVKSGGAGSGGNGISSSSICNNYGGKGDAGKFHSKVLTTGDKVKTIALNCLRCFKTQTSHFELNKHMKAEHSIEQHPCFVRGCTCSFTEFHPLKSHVLEAHLKATDNNGGARLDCAFCTETFANHDALRHHTLNRHQEGKFSCLKCPANVVLQEKTRQPVLEHFEQAHPAQQQDEDLMILTKNIHCPPPGRCGAEFIFNKADKAQSEAMLLSHLEKDHRTKQFTCYYLGCTASCETIEQLEAHCKEVHPKVWRWKCPYCDFTDRDHKVFYQHLYDNHFPGDFYCNHPSCSEKPIKMRSRQDVYNHYNKKHLKKEQPPKSATSSATKPINEKMFPLLDKPYWQEKLPQK